MLGLNISTSPWACLCTKMLPWDWLIGYFQTGAPNKLANESIFCFCLRLPKIGIIWEIKASLLLSHPHSAHISNLHICSTQLIRNPYVITLMHLIPLSVIFQHFGLMLKFWWLNIIKQLMIRISWFPPPGTKAVFLFALLTKCYKYQFKFYSLYRCSAVCLHSYPDS